VIKGNTVIPEKDPKSWRRAAVAQAMSLLTIMAASALSWAIIYVLFAYLPWQMTVLLLVAAIATLVVLFRPPPRHLGGRSFELSRR
jgi:hypothetical protein